MPPIETETLCTGGTLSEHGREHPTVNRSVAGGVHLVFGTSFTTFTAFTILVLVILDLGEWSERSEWVT